MLTRLSALFQHIKGNGPSESQLERELSLRLTEGRSLREELESILEGSFENYAYWIEAHEGESHNCLLCAAPIRVGQILHGHLYRGKNTIIFTKKSAAEGPGF